MNFNDLKGKFENFISSIKSKFSKKDESNESDNEDMITIDNYYNSGDKSSENYDSNSENKLKKSLQTAKSFITDADYNPFIDQKEVREVDKKEFKERWFISFIKAIITLIIVFLFLLCSIMIYKLGYDLLNDTNVASIGGYSDFLVPENNLAPDIDENDLIIVKNQESYVEGDIILYKFAGTSHKIGKVKYLIRGYYIITDNNIQEDDYNSRIAVELVVGKQIKTIKNFKGMYDFITSPFAIVLLVGIIGLYFYLMLKGKVKDKGNI